MPCTGEVAVSLRVDDPFMPGMADIGDDFVELSRTGLWCAESVCAGWPCCANAGDAATGITTAAIRIVYAWQRCLLNTWGRASAKNLAGMNDIYKSGSNRRGAIASDDQMVLVIGANPAPGVAANSAWLGTPRTAAERYALGGGVSGATARVIGGRAYSMYTDATIILVACGATATDGSAVALHPVTAGQQLVPVELSHGAGSCWWAGAFVGSLPAWRECCWDAAGTELADAPGIDADCPIAAHGAAPIPVNTGISRTLSRIRTTRLAMGEIYGTARHHQSHDYTLGGIIPGPGPGP
jgi:hypothetical protein